ncbi:MAG: septum formation protein Maf [Clostridia bacterium]|nr:septum formation protein Maf [Clostridia bacterium]
MNFVLASKSPRRKEILSGVGLQFDIIESNVDESTVSKELPPHFYVQELAMLKSTDIASKIKGSSYVIGADTVVVSNGKIIGKPQSFEDAFNMLSSFSGSSHKVISGISVTNSEDMTTVTDYCETEVVFYPMSDAEISDYINTYKPYDKAGAYGIQEYAGVFVEKINGDYYNVVGLPLSKLYQLLKREFGVII